MLAVATIIVLWNSPVGTKSESIEVVKTVEPSTETNSTTQLNTSKPVTQLSFKSAKEAKKYVESYANEKGYNIDDYPEKLFDLMVKDSTSIDFVLDYPLEINKEHNSKLEADKFETIPLFIQWDTRWGYHQFKNGVVGIDGCGATCLSMAAVYLKQDASLTPDILADFAADNGYFVNGSGISWSFFEDGVKHFGLKSRGVSINEDSLKKAVNNGNPVIVSVREGDFTRKGHYIVIAGLEDGKFIINDPFSVVNSEKRWTWKRIKPQIKNMWEIYQ